ncbi:hypothetical protein [Vibrio cholerae]|nr:hypothetical protein [Vibrio cholerae]
MLDFTLLAVIWDGIKMHKWVLVTHRLTSNLTMEVLENTENDRQIDHQFIVCCVMFLSIRARKQ